MTLRLYSSLGRETREFRPVSPGKVRIYVCGVTPYNVTHLGHAFSYVQFDTLRRYLGWKGYDVRYVQNVTDIDDDMIRVSKLQGGRPIPEIRDENDAIFRNDLDRLNVLRPSAYPFATDHIPQIIETHGQAHRPRPRLRGRRRCLLRSHHLRPLRRLNGVSLTDLAKRENPESKRAHKKRGALDFLLWQHVTLTSRRGTARGAPAARAGASNVRRCPSTHLGDQIDIHGGGSDLRSPTTKTRSPRQSAPTGCDAVLRLLAA